MGHLEVDALKDWKIVYYFNIIRITKGGWIIDKFPASVPCGPHKPVCVEKWLALKESEIEKLSCPNENWIIIRIQGRLKYRQEVSDEDAL